MACLKVRNQQGVTRLIAEGPDGNVRGVKGGETVIGVKWDCGPNAVESVYFDTEKIISSEGLMVGNLVKKITNALHIKQCLKCKGRQRKWNKKGLEIQQKIKSAILG